MPENIFVRFFGDQTAFGVSMFFGMLAGLIALAITAVLAPQRFIDFGRRLVRWLPLIALVAFAVVFNFVLPYQYRPTVYFAESALPSYFRTGYWHWLFLALTGLGVSCRALWRSVKGRGKPAATGGPLDGPWGELVEHLRRAKVELPRERIQVLLTADEDASRRATDLPAMADARTKIVAPEGPSPLRAAALARGGVLLACDGDWAGGLLGEGPRRAADLGRRLRPDGDGRPEVTGLSVVFPVDWVGRSASLDQAAVAGEEARDFIEALEAPCPIHVLFVGMEDMPGMATFISRRSAAKPGHAEERVRFRVPPSHVFDDKTADDAIDWVASWFDRQVIDLLAARPFDYKANAELIGLVREFRRRRGRLAKVLQVAFGQRADLAEGRLPFRGAFFSATGEAPEERAFAAGLFNGGRPPLLGPRPVGRSASAAWEGVRLRRASTMIGAGTALGALAAWFFLPASRVASAVGLAGLTAVWAAALGARWFRLSRAAPAR